MRMMPLLGSQLLVDFAVDAIGLDWVGGDALTMFEGWVSDKQKRRRE
jgi:hypothetical protein